MVAPDMSQLGDLALGAANADVRRTESNESASIVFQKDNLAVGNSAVRDQ